MHYGIIHANSVNIIDIEKLPYITSGEEPKKYSLIKNGDLILADTSEDRADAAKGIEIFNSDLIPAVGGLHTIHLREKTKKTIDGYKTFYISSSYFRSFAKKYCEGIKVFSIKPSLLKYAHFAFPKQLNEQIKIVDFLKKINEKTDLTERKIETLKKYKKGIQNRLFVSKGNNGFHSLRDLVTFEPKSPVSAGDSIETGKYTLYKSGQSNGTINTYSHEGIYIVANDGGTASFKLTNGKFSYTDHCICFKCKSEEETIVLGNFLQMNEKKMTYIGFTGTGLKNIDRQYLGMFKVPEINNKKIAPIFMKIDESINMMNKRLNLLAKIKKQLLAAMFI